jgi:F0F1-type ATP synthase assembly protein I
VVIGLIGGSVASMAVLSAMLLETDQRAAAWAGMIGPLLAATATLLLLQRTSARAPDRVTSTMMHAFAAKIVFFLAYVVLALRVLELDAMPFVVSFTVYFVALHGAVAVWLQRRFIASLPHPR